MGSFLDHLIEINSFASVRPLFGFGEEVGGKGVKVGVAAVGIGGRRGEEVIAGTASLDCPRDITAEFSGGFK